jgi:hypothetical protein
LAWIMGVCNGLRRSQSKALGELVFGAMRSRRISLADIGRSMAGEGLVNSRIKRVDRFVGNSRVQVAEGMRALVRLAARAAGWRLVVAVDWVDIGRYKVLRAAVPLRGRSVPIMFAAYRQRQLKRSQNALEEGFFVLLKVLLPKRAQVVVIADRGFARAELAWDLEGIGLDYVVRVCGKVVFESERYSGLLSDVELYPGDRLDLGWGLYRQKNPVRRRLAACWARGHLEPWLLGTNLRWGIRRLAQIFEQRIMMIEELFRDEKNIRYGWGLRQMRLSTTERLERMFLILAFAYILLLLMGLICKQQLSPAHWSSTTSKTRPTSAFLVGRIMQHKRRFRLGELLALLRLLLQAAAEANWG